MSNEDKWLVGALDYIPRWIELQMQWTDQPGCAIAVAKDGTTLLEAAFGHADLPAGKTLTPRHRFRVASHSKTFTAAGILKLREQGALQLDDPVGRYVGDLHPEEPATEGVVDGRDERLFILALLGPRHDIRLTGEYRCHQRRDEW